MARTWNKVQSRFFNHYHPNGNIVASSLKVMTKDSGSRGDKIVGDFKSPLPYSWNRTVLIGDPKGYSLQNGYRYDGMRPDGGILPLPASHDAGLYNQALEKFYENLRGTLDLSVSVLEARKTQKMITKKLSQLADIVKSVRSVRRSSSEASKVWLEYQYGWRPLVNDLFLIHDQALNQARNELVRVRYRRGFRNVVELASIDWGTMSSHGGRSYLKGDATDRSSVEISAFLNLAHLPSAGNWTSLNPISIGWELLPFSFVCDWVFDVGSYLRSYETHLLYSGVPTSNGYISRYTSRILRSPPQSKLGGSAELDVLVDGAFAHKYLYDRTLFSSLPRPQRPRFKVSLGSSRLLSAAALLRAFAR